MPKKYFIILFVLFALFVLFKNKHSPAIINSAIVPTVSTVQVHSEVWQQEQRWLGDVKAEKSIAVSSVVAGAIATIFVSSGQAVQKGQILMTLHAEALQAAVDRASNIYHDALQSYQRRRQLLPMHYIAQADIDHLKAMMLQYKAEWEQQKALLDQYTIKAPFSGLLGILQVTEGQYVAAGRPLIDLEADNPVYIDFSVPENQLNYIYAGQPIAVIFNGNKTKLYNGNILTTAHTIDASNRSCLVRAVVSNPDHELLTGMAVTVIVKQSPVKQVSLPESALSYSIKGIGVYQLQASKIIHWQPVTIISHQHDKVIIGAGIKDGDQIVVGVQPSLNDGMQVAVNNNQQPILE